MVTHKPVHNWNERDFMKKKKLQPTKKKVEKLCGELEQLLKIDVYERFGRNITELIAEYRMQQYMFLKRPNKSSAIALLKEAERNLLNVYDIFGDLFEPLQPDTLKRLGAPRSKIDGLTKQILYSVFCSDKYGEIFPEDTNYTVSNKFADFQKSVERILHAVRMAAALIEEGSDDEVLYLFEKKKSALVRNELMREWAVIFIECFGLEPTVYKHGNFVNSVRLLLACFRTNYEGIKLEFSLPENIEQLLSKLIRKAREDIGNPVSNVRSGWDMPLFRSDANCSNDWF